jgi:Glycosyl transferase family 64 domain
MSSYSWSDPLHHFRERISSRPSRQHTSSSSSKAAATPKMSIELSTANRCIDAILDPQRQEVLPLVQNSSKYVKDRETSSFPRNIVRETRARWYRLKPRTRRVILFGILPIVLFYFAIDIFDTLFPQYGLPVADVLSFPLPVANRNEFVVIINTYQRPLLLLDAVQHYAEKCGPKIGIKSVYVIWAEEKVTPPAPEHFFDRHLPKKRSQVSVLSVPNSLNSRFLPIPDVQDMAVFMVDDDIRVDCHSLKTAFLAWKMNPSSMVGFYPRLAEWDLSDDGKRHIRAPPERFIYQSWPIVYWRQRMNFILTKACFLHSHYMSVYSDPNQHPIEILQYVDKYFNCEDVAMSLLVANITKPTDGTLDGLPVRPIYVEGSVSDKGLFNGISTGTGHMARRSECLSDLSNLYQMKGWGIPLDREFPLRKSSWRRHTPGFWWQYRPSNVFEWFALSNIFK